MAAVAPAATLSLADPKSEGGKGPETKDKASGGLNGVSKGEVVSLNPPASSAEPWAQQDYMDAAMYYGAYPGAYYCGGWGDYSVYVSQDGGDALFPGVYGDMYCYPQYGSADGQIYGSQHYQYPSTYYQPKITASKPVYKAKTGKSSPSIQDVSTPTAADQQPALLGSSKTTLKSIDGVKGPKKETLPLKPNGRFGNYQNQGSKTAYPWSGGRISSEKHPKFSGGSPTSTASNNNNNKGLQGQNSPMGLPSAGFMSSMYSGSGMYNTNTYAPSFWYGSHVYGPGLYGGWNVFSNGKYRPRGKTYGSYGFGNENLDGLDELKRGPRSSLFKNQQGSGAAVDAKGEGTPSSDDSNAFKQDQYNLADFGETYSDAKFFIIKSYSEDDVHKSIKYNVWASTPSGNKKLDAAYQAAKEKSSSCPVFLLFSVNTSGQFVGLAEMVGRVDFNKTVDYWQQDKWTGCFPVKWHIVKDVPNSLLKHIILEYNENKPVTNSRDTQEVKLDQGLQVLKIFKDHVCKTSILDDFSFYDDREKRMQEKKSKRQYPVEVMNRKLVATNNVENQATDGKQRLQKPEAIGEQNAVVENGAVAVAANGVTPRELTAMVENGVVAVAVNGVTPEDVKPTTDEAGVANGC